MNNIKINNNEKNNIEINNIEINNIEINNNEKKEKITKLKELRDIIETSNVLHHKEILRILKDNNCSISSNRNGSFINLTKIDENVVDKINIYLEHVNKQETELKEKYDAQENEKQQFINY